MVRKTVTIKDDIFLQVQNRDISKDYNSFSDMVSSALELLLKEKKKERYKQAMLEASKDKLYLQDMQEIEDDFKYADFEN